MTPTSKVGDKTLLEAIITKFISHSNAMTSTSTLEEQPLLFHEAVISQLTSHHQWHDSTSTLRDKP